MLTDQAELNEGLIYVENMSLDCRVIDQQPEDSYISLINETNEALLKAIGALGESVKESSDDGSAMVQEIIRLDAKLNLILDLVGQMLLNQLDIPKPCPVKLHPKGVSWESDQPPEIGQLVAMQIYLQSGVPKPLAFFGKVVSTPAEQQAGSVNVAFFGVSQPVEEVLEKFIFRQHRRAIAQAKTGD